MMRANRARLVRLGIAGICGVAAGLQTWRETATASPRRLILQLPAFGMALIFTVAGLWTKRLPVKSDVPPRPGTIRLAGIFLGTMFASPVLTLPVSILGTPKMRRRWRQDFEDQRRRYRDAARDFEHANWRSCIANLFAVPSLPTSSIRRLVMITWSLASGGLSAFSTWRITESGGQSSENWQFWLFFNSIGPLSSAVRNMGVLPSRFWIPRPIRIAVLILFTPVYLAISFAFLLMSLSIWRTLFKRRDGGQDAEHGPE